MPTILRTNGFRFFFYINDYPPPHIHIEKDESTAKFNLEPVELVYSKRFSAQEINLIRKLVIENKELLTTRWDERFNNQ